MTAAVSSALQGVRILDFSWVLAGPFATRLLADFGAEIIKVQPLLPEAEDAYSQAYYENWNRNKLGLSLDMSQPDGLQIARRLAAVSDAVVENFSPRVMSNWGLDYEGLKSLKPDIILLSLSVMGHSGPWQDYSGFGAAVQAFAGMTHLTAYKAQNPVGPGYAYSDHIAGLYGALALQGALLYRARTGQGQFIDLSQTECLTSLLAESLLQYSRDNKAVRPRGNRSEVYAPEGVFPCLGEDNWCAISVKDDAEWQRFKQALNSPAAFNAAKYDSREGRLRFVDLLEQEIGQITRNYQVENLVELLQASGLAAARVKSAADLMTDADLNSRGFFIHMQHPVKGDITGDASPLHLSDIPAAYARPAPQRGQDNDYVLGTLLGYSPAEIAQFRQAKVI